MPQFVTIEEAHDVSDFTVDSASMDSIVFTNVPIPTLNLPEDRDEPTFQGPLPVGNYMVALGNMRPQTPIEDIIDNQKLIEAE